MSCTIRALDAASYEAYEDLVRSDPRSMVYASLGYRAFLERVLPGSEARYFVASRDGALVGALPLFVKRDAAHGAVVNSLPFYGSHGAVTLRPGIAEPQSAGASLMEAYADTTKEAGAVAATLIDSPYRSSAELHRRRAARTLEDERISQITELPQGPLGEAAAEEALLAQLHQKTRNSVRKGLKSGLRVGHEAGAATLEALARMHREGIEALGGQAKPLSVFRALADSFAYDRDYRIYTAHKDGILVAALLVLYYHRTVEYFTPATEPAYRELQPMSVLIFEAMREAVRRRFLCWNWGGTWKSQQGVYQFKKRWGSVERPYKYHVDIHDPAVLGLSREEILAAYPNFYVAPFGALSA